MITLPSPADGPVTLRLYDLNGRLIARKSVGRNELAGSTLRWNIARDVRGLGRGLYTVQLSGRSIRKIFRIALAGN